MNPEDAMAEAARLFILNSPVLTGYGTWRFEGPLGIEAARECLSQGEFVSTVGHAASAEFLSTLLGVEIPVNRIRVELEPGERALVLRLKERLPEGQVLSADEMKRFPFELGLLTRIE